MSREHRRMDRFIIIPFSSGCRSNSSVDVVDTRHKKPRGGGGGGGGGEEKQKGDSLMARVLRGFKNLSQIFAVYEEDDDGEEEEREMIIGYPTDVKHVAHIGWDGSTNTTQSVRTWNRSAPPPDAPPAAAPNAPQPPSVRQLELAMAAQAAGASTSSTSTTGHCYSVAG